MPWSPASVGKLRKALASCAPAWPCARSGFRTKAKAGDGAKGQGAKAEEGAGNGENALVVSGPERKHHKVGCAGAADGAWHSARAWERSGVGGSQLGLGEGSDQSGSVGC